MGNEQQPNAGDGIDGKGGGQKTDPQNPGAGSGGNDQKTNTGAEKSEFTDWKPEQYQQEITNLRKEREEAKKTASDYEKLKKTVGRQSEQIGMMNRIFDGFDKDREGTIKALAKEYNIPIQIGEPAKNLPANFFEESDDGKKPDPKQLENFIKDQVSSQIGEQTKAMFQTMGIVIDGEMKKNYPDFDDPEMVETREVIAAGMRTQRIPQKELLHLAARGAKIGKAIEAAKTDAVEEYKKSLADKSQEQIPSGSRREPESREDNEKRVAGAIKAIRAVRHRI